MKFIYSPYSIEMDWEEGENCVLQVESPKAFVDILSDVFEQMNHGTGEAVLSDGKKSIDIQKNAEMIFEPFSLDFNNRKIKNALYQELSEITLQNHFSDYTAICSGIQEFLEHIFMEVPYSVTYQSAIRIEELLKMESVSLDYVYDTPAEKISIYIRLLSRACGINTVFFVDLSRYLSKEEIGEIIKEAQYDKISIIFINSSAMEKDFDNTVHYILDDSLCFWKV